MSIDRLPPVGHVGVVVADMDRALEEIRQIFGIDGAGKVYDFTPMNVWAWGEKNSRLPDSDRHAGLDRQPEAGGAPARLWRD